MNLSDFIKETLKDISKGIKEAQSENKGIWEMHINPIFSPYSRVSTGVLGTTGGGDNVYFVHFDVAISVAEEKAKGGEAKLSVWSSSIGANLKRGTTEGVVSRISFDVPVTFPRK